MVTAWLRGLRDQEVSGMKPSLQLGVLSLTWGLGGAACMGVDAEAQ